jgi:hypothetical protein
MYTDKLKDKFQLTWKIPIERYNCELASKSGLRDNKSLRTALPSLLKVKGLLMDRW